MAQSRLLGIHIPTAGDLTTTAAAASQIQQTIEALEPYLIGHFPNADARDAAWANVPGGPTGGTRCWLGSPAGHYTWYPGGVGWLPDAIPGAGDGATFVRSQVAASDLTWTDPTNADFGCGQTFPIPSWARQFGGQAQIMAWLHTPVDKGTEGAATVFNLAMKYSLDGGSSFDGSSVSSLRGPDVTATCTLAAKDSPDTINVANVTNIQAGIVVRQRVAGTGQLRRVAGSSKVIWLATFTRGS